jgi:hypothetical protein
MKPGWQVLLGISALIAVNRNAAAEASEPEPSSSAVVASHSDVRLETTKLLKLDSERIAAQERQASPSAATPEATPGTVVMRPYEIRESKLPDAAVRRNESPVMRFIRDGTLYENRSTRILLHFYNTGALGPDDPPAPVLGNVKPVNGIQLVFTWGW